MKLTLASRFLLVRKVGAFPLGEPKTVYAVSGTPLAVVEVLDVSDSLKQQYKPGERLVVGCARFTDNAEFVITPECIAGLPD